MKQPLFRTVSQNLILFLAAFLIAALFAELTLRIVLPNDRKRKRYMGTRTVLQYDTRYVRHDPELGYAPRPDISIPFANEEFRTRVSTNSLGFRDDEASLSGPRILLLGDSYGFGWGVEKDETVESLLERDSGVRVLNMGVPGYGTIQEYLIFRRWLTGHDGEGAVAVFLLYPNDLFDDNLGNQFGSYPTVNENRPPVSFSPVPESAYDEWIARCVEGLHHGLNKASYLAYEFHGLLKIKKKIRQMLKERREGVVPAGPRGAEERDLEVFESVVGEIKRTADEHGVRVVFAYCPSVFYYEDEKRIDDDDMYRGSSAVLERHGIPLIDLRPVLARNDYYLLDDHWTAQGHRKVAAAIADYLRKNGYLREAAGAAV